MTPLRTKISEASKAASVPQYVIEKDYALSYILAGIAETPTLAHSLVFKGGTALKKMYFGEYRFSEDLDFSASNSPTGAALMKSLQTASEIAKNMLTEFGPFAIELNRNPEKRPHPNGQEAFIVNVQFPWHRTPMCRIKVEITQDEIIELTPEHRTIIHGYDETLTTKVASYQITEIVAEKLRALLQTYDKLIQKGWSRSRPRDYYDLWRILKDYRDQIDQKKLQPVLQKKCALRGVQFASIDDSFPHALIESTKSNWQGSLSALIQNLPSADTVLSETRRLADALIQPRTSGV